MKEFCNPINLEYKFQHYGEAAHREAADPTLIYFKGRYYIFASMSAGFYHSDNLTDWTWHENRALDMYLYAPDVRQGGEYLYFCASNRGVPCSIYRTLDPLGDKFEKVSTPFDFWDPNLLFDDDGKVYLFWGCGNWAPLYGVELDAKTMTPIGKKIAVIHQDKESHGFERFNYPGKGKPIKRKASLPTKVLMYFLHRAGKPYMEGSFCTKFGGQYYLQYAAPDTAADTYGDGVYIADKPLGPYRFQPHNPFSFKPSGFINGAGHGSTVEDEHGNIWHAASMSISIHAEFERRVGLFPSGLDKDGVLYCNQNFADYPYIIPDGKFDASQLSPRYMLLSYKKAASASSVLSGHGTELALNENIRDWWCAEGGAGECFTVDLGKVYRVHSVQINLAEEQLPVMRKPKEDCGLPIVGGRYIDSGLTLRTRYVLEGSADGKSWRVLKDAAEAESDRSHDYVVLPEDMGLRYFRITSVELAYGQRFAISGFRVFGLDSGAKPSPVKSARSERTDELTARVFWNKTAGAVGYNLRYGIAQDKLYTSYLIYEHAEALLTAPNKRQSYWYRVDSFNESGVTEGQLFRIEAAG